MQEFQDITVIYIILWYISCIIFKIYHTKSISCSPRQPFFNKCRPPGLASELEYNRLAWLHLQIGIYIKSLTLQFMFRFPLDLYLKVNIPFHSTAVLPSHLPFTYIHISFWIHIKNAKVPIQIFAFYSHQDLKFLIWLVELIPW